MNIIDARKLNPVVRHVRISTGTKKTYYLPRRMIYDFELVFIYSGKLKITKDDEEFILSKNELHIMPPYVWHKREIVGDENLCCYNIHFDFYDVEENPEINVVKEYCTPCWERVKEVSVNPLLKDRKIYYLKEFLGKNKFKLNNISEFVHVFVDMESHFDGNSRYKDLLVKSDMLKILSIILDDEATGGGINETDCISGFISLVGHIDYIYNLQKFVSSYGITENYFRRIFKEKMNQSPYEYFINTHITMAKDLLMSGTMTVKEVSEYLKYDDEFYFSRLFKKKVGLSPKQYQIKNRS